MSKSTSRAVPRLIRLRLGEVLLQLLILLLWLGTLAPLQAQFKYTTNSGTITITAYTGSGGAVIIPGETNGYPVTSIGFQAFGQSPSLVTSVIIPDSVTNIGRSAFPFCTLLTDVTMSTNVIAIGDYVFDGCRNLRSITLPNTLTSLGVYAFASCRALTNVDLGQSLTRIQDHAFDSCSNLVSISIPQSVTNIGIGAFFLCLKLTSFSLGSGVLNIGSQAFEGCESLTSLQIPAAVNNIGDLAFYNCFNVTNLALAGSLTNIGNSAFYFCTGLPTLALPNGLTRIGNSAFFFCTNLATVSIPGSLTNIGTSAFQYCRHLTTFNVDSNNSAYSSLDGVLFDKSYSSLIQCPGARTGSYNVPGGVTNIGTTAFAGSALSNITLPAGLISIGDAAFAYCLGLTACFFQGDAPLLGSGVFTSDSAVVYYLPWTTGWGPTFGGLTALPWVPQIQTDKATFGIQANQFGFDIGWIDGTTIIIESCTNLAAPTWIPVTTNVLNNGSIYFADPGWKSYPRQYYRVRSSY